jgi:hypothetical protein
MCTINHEFRCATGFASAMEERPSHDIALPEPVAHGVDLRWILQCVFVASVPETARGNKAGAGFFEDNWGSMIPKSNIRQEMLPRRHNPRCRSDASKAFLQNYRQSF